MTEPLDYESLFNRWDALTKTERWSLDAGDIHNIVDVAKCRLDDVLALRDHSFPYQRVDEEWIDVVRWDRVVRAATGDA